VHCFVDILISDNYYKSFWISQHTNVKFETENRSIASGN